MVATSACSASSTDRYSASLCWASAVAASAVEATRPNRSASYDTVPWARQVVTGCVGVPSGSPCDTAEGRWRVGPKPASTLGKKPERASRCRARAWARRTAAAFRSWLACCASSSRRFSVSSLKIFHQAPRSAASEGCAVFQEPASAGGRAASL